MDVEAEPWYPIPDDEPYPILQADSEPFKCSRCGTTNPASEPGECDDADCPLEGAAR